MGWNTLKKLKCTFLLNPNIHLHRLMSETLKTDNCLCQIRWHLLDENVLNSILFWIYFRIFYSFYFQILDYFGYMSFLNYKHLQTLFFINLKKNHHILFIFENNFHLKLRKYQIIVYSQKLFWWYNDDGGGGMQKMKLMISYLNSPKQDCLLKWRWC